MKNGTLKIGRRKFPVENTRRHKDRDGVDMTKRVATIAVVDGKLDVSGMTLDWTNVPAQDGRPEMWRTEGPGQIEIWLKGLTPDQVEDGIVGRIEVKARGVTKHKSGNSPEVVYFYLNVGPLPEGTDVEKLVSLHSGSSSTEDFGWRELELPQRFDPKNDFVVHYPPNRLAAIIIRDANATPGVNFAAWNLDWKESAPATEIASVAASLSSTGPAVVVEIDTKSDNHFTVVMDASGSKQIAQAIYDERFDDAFPKNGVVATWTPDPAPAPAA